VTAEPEPLGKDQTAPARPFRRRVFYIPGYDPFPPRRYRELYRREGAAQAALSGYTLTQHAAKTNGWHVTATMEAVADTEVEVLIWSDLVQGSMGRGILATYLVLLRTAWIYAASGALWRLIRLRKGPMIAALYPPVILVLQGIVALAVAWAVIRFAGRLPAQSEWLLAALVLYGVLHLFRRIDRHLFVYYLMHDYAFTAMQRGAYPAALAARLDDFRTRISAALTSDVDEVLVVGHSSGAHLGVSVLADLIRAGMPAHAPALGLLTLGQVVPMVSFLPHAGRLRGDLAYLSASAALTWVDVTAPGDGCTFALCDPVAVTGVAPPDQRWPLVISAAFTQTLSPQRWRSLRWRFFRLHFQYLCAFDNLSGGAGDYDYFRITAGPMTLGDRYRGRPPSQSRITRALNPYRSLG
jgi:hypothetical protein